MSRIMNEMEILNGFENAIRTNALCPFYQGQFNHSTGRLVGAEALMRWIHPEYGIQSPAVFIPIFEKYDLITRADLHIFECVCIFQRKCLDNNQKIVPISINLSRIDITKDYCIPEMERIRTKYDIDVDYIRIEITESSAIGGMELLLNRIEELHSYGYVVEMDDFGSGYSSLNVLKDLPVDIIKLDMKFFNGMNNGREGIIIGSIISMSKWLDTPVIAEGVEEVDQADYLKAIGCNYVQGYLYAKPISEEDFLIKMSMLSHEPNPIKNVFSGFDTKDFWDPNSNGSVFFTRFMGPAAFFSYLDGDVEIIRVNPRYVKELGMNMSEWDIIHQIPWDNHTEESKAIYIDTIKRAVESKDEECCRTWRTIRSKCCGEDSICIESHIQLMGFNGKQYIFMARIHNITNSIMEYMSIKESEKKFRMASEQNNTYAWEWDIATHDMRPCSRCKRDLGFADVMKDYPEIAIKLGVFPEDYAEQYREYHRKMEKGEIDSFEEVIPLTKDRVPFIVRYTVEQDENGRPLKAYGSATLLIENE